MKYLILALSLLVSFASAMQRSTLGNAPQKEKMPQVITTSVG